MAAPDFWNNRERAQTDVDEVSRLRSLINPFHELEREIEDFEALHQLAAEERNDAHACPPSDVKSRPSTIVSSTRLEEFELRHLLSGESDQSNAFITRSTAPAAPRRATGRTCSCACTSAGLSGAVSKSQIVDIQTGEEVGIKSATLLVSGEYAYGYLQGRARRPSARADLAVRCQQTPPHFLRQRRCCA